MINQTEVMESCHTLRNLSPFSTSMVCETRDLTRQLDTGANHSHTAPWSV